MEWIILVALVLVFLLLLSTYGAVENLRRAQEGLRTDLWRLEQATTGEGALGTSEDAVEAAWDPGSSMWARHRLAKSGDPVWQTAAEKAHADVLARWPRLKDTTLALDLAARASEPGKPPPEWAKSLQEEPISLERVRARADRERRTAEEARVGRPEIVHMAPAGSGFTPCCRRSPFELPQTDRLTVGPELVTCKGRG